MVLFSSRVRSSVAALKLQKSLSSSQFVCVPEGWFYFPALGSFPEVSHLQGFVLGLCPWLCQPGFVFLLAATQHPPCIAPAH